MVTMSETDLGTIGVPMKVGASLTSPPGTNFDLYLYVEDTGLPSARACTTPVVSSTNASGPDSVTHSWGEATLANGTDDTRIVSLEVRYVSGTCAPGATWTLIVK